MASMTHAFEHRAQFLDEKRTAEAYISYGKGVSQWKSGLRAKDLVRSWTLSSFGKGGA